MRAAMLPGTFNTNSCPTLSDPSQLPAWAGPLTSPCNCAATWCSSSQALTGMRLDSRKRHVAQATEAQDRAQQHRPSPPGPSSAGPSAHSSKLVVPGCRSCCGAQRYKITHTSMPHTAMCERLFGARLPLAFRFALQLSTNSRQACLPNSLKLGRSTARPLPECRARGRSL